MEVSLLLKRLDILNEEGQQIQNEIKKISDAIADLQYREEKTKTDISILVKKNTDTPIQKDTSIIEMTVELE